MASVTEIVRGISQAAANAYDGALDEKGDPIKIGLRREEDVSITDRRVMDGFKVAFHGPILCIKYHSEISLKEVHDKNRFETDIESKLGDIAKFLRKEYKTVTGNSLTLTADGEPQILVQSISNKRSWVQAYRYYNIGGLKEVEETRQESEDKLDDSVRKWLGSNGNRKRAAGSAMFGKDTHSGAKKPKNVTGKRDEEPKTLWTQRSQG